MNKLKLTIVLLFICFAVFGQRPGVVGYWKMENTSIRDERNLNDGTNVGGTIVSGKVGNCWQGDNTDYINFGDRNKFTFGNGTSDIAFSISGWVYVNNLTTRQAICGKGANINTETEYVFFLFDTDGRLSMQLHDQFGGERIGVNQTTGSMTSGTWYFVTGAYGGSGVYTDIDLYIDATPIATTANTAGTYVAMQNTTNQFQGGGYWTGSGSGQRLDGKLDELMLHRNVKLNQNQISQLYQNDLGRLYVWQNFINGKISYSDWLDYSLKLNLKS